MPTADEAPNSNQPPVAVFSAYPPLGAAPLTINLDGSASADLDGHIATYTWDLGDNSPTAVGPVVDHRYQAAGHYPVILTVTDNEGASHQQQQTVVVVAAAVPELPMVPQHSISLPALEPVAVVRETSLVVSVADPSGRLLTGADLVIQWPLGMQTAHADEGVAMFATGDQTLPTDWLGKAVTITASAEAHRPQSRQIVIVAGLDNTLTLTLIPEQPPSL